MPCAATLRDEPSWFRPPDQGRLGPWGRTPLGVPGKGKGAPACSRPTRACLSGGSMDQGPWPHSFQTRKTPRPQCHYFQQEMSPRVTKDNVRCCVVAKSGCGWREVMAPCGDSATRLSSREVTSDVTARPGPGRPGPKSRTGHGWLVQGAVWSPGLRPRLALRRGDLGLLHGAPAECACRWRPRAGAGSMRALSREVWCRLNPADASPWVV